MTTPYEYTLAEIPCQLAWQESMFDRLVPCQFPING